MMKKIFRHIFAIGALSLVVACSLKEDTSVITTPGTYFKTEIQLRSALNYCYAPFHSIHVASYELALEGTTDLASANYNAQKDAKMDITPASCGCGTTVWSNCWYGLRYCLSTRAGINRCDIPQDVKDKYLAEVIILESMYYYILTSFFGDVPFYEDYVQTDEDMTRITALGRMPASETRTTLIAELNAYIPKLEQVRSCEIQNNYVGAAVGWMMIAKMSAWNKDWSSVIEAGKKLEEIYGDLNQYPYEDVWFRNKNTPESIFEIQHTYTPGGLDKHSNLATICMPYPRTSGTDLYNGVSIPELGDQTTVYRPMMPTSYFKSQVLRAGRGDVRRDCTIVTEWNEKSFSNAWCGPKLWCPLMQNGQDGNNYKVYRYADAVLLLSEAYCELGQYDDSIRYLNMVRSRAGLADYGPFESYIKLREEIRRERGRELFGEFGRKYDLVRWGVWYSQVVTYNPYTTLLKNIKPCHEYYPIPDAQVIASNGALDNKEYEKYGINY